MIEIFMFVVMALCTASSGYVAWVALRRQVKKDELEVCHHRIDRVQVLIREVEQSLKHVCTHQDLNELRSAQQHIVARLAEMPSKSDMASIYETLTKLREGMARRSAQDERNRADIDELRRQVKP